MPTIINLATLGSAGFRMKGELTGDMAGRSVSNVGDVNGDGIDDVIVGAYSADAGGLNSGRAYVVYGKTTGLASIDLTNLGGANGFIIQGDADQDELGLSVSSAGDATAMTSTTHRRGGPRPPRPQPSPAPPM